MCSDDDGMYLCSCRASILDKLCPSPPTEAADDWQPMSTAPDTDGDLLLFCADTGEQFVGYRSGAGLFCYAIRPDGGRIVCRPTHWRPTPPPPRVP
jgi:hypothetical protein